MKIAFLIVMFSIALARCQEPNVYVHGAGDKWYSAGELERIARDYVKKKKIQFIFEGTERSVWIGGSSSNVIARVSFASGMGKPILTVDIDRSGQVATNQLGVAYCEVGGPKIQELPPLDNPK